METLYQQLKLFNDDAELLSLVGLLDEVLQRQEYCPFVVRSVKRYIESAEPDEFRNEGWE